MALFDTPEKHAANPPSTWQVVKVWDRCWHVQTQLGVTIASTKTKREAEALTREGFYVNLYDKERRWFAGEPVTGWRPYRQAGPTSS